MIFEFNWFWYEDYQPYLLEHSSRREEEFKSDCIWAMSECFETYFKRAIKKERWMSIPAWTEAACEKLSEKGYMRVFPVKFGFCGGFIVSEEDIADEEFECLPREMIERMVLYNNKIRVEQDKEVLKQIEKERANAIS